MSDIIPSKEGFKTSRERSHLGDITNIVPMQECPTIETIPNTYKNISLTARGPNHPKNSPPYTCRHPNILTDENTKSSNCEICGIFITNKGEISIREENKEFKIEVPPKELLFNMITHSRPTIKTSLSKGVPNQMRRVLVDWICEVGELFKLGNPCIHRGVSYLDQIIGHYSIHKDQLQLLGLTSLLIAGKFLELDRKMPTMKSLIKACKGKHTELEFKQEEVKVLRVLNFDLSYTTPMDFLELFLGQGILFPNHLMALSAGSTPPANKIALYLRKYAEFFADLCLQGIYIYIIYIDYKFQEYSGIVLACGIIACSRKAVKLRDIWNDSLTQLTSICFSEVKPCFIQIYKYSVYI